MLEEMSLNELRKLARRCGVPNATMLKAQELQNLIFAAFVDWLDETEEKVESGRGRKPARPFSLSEMLTCRDRETLEEFRLLDLRFLANCRGIRDTVASKSELIDKIVEGGECSDYFDTIGRKTKFEQRMSRIGYCESRTELFEFRRRELAAFIYITQKKVMPDDATKDRLMNTILYNRKWR